ncbi:MAG: LysM peptidoglycan-binding domain-containing protein [Planctomycetes bacterium]|nr:LysM peptidoglycan-binding domain-containing protein [Planctomycetota bacterium]
MTLPSQSPRSSSPLSSGARNAKGMRSLFVAVAALGLGGAAAGWFLTHRSESPEPLAGSTNTADTIADPLNASAAGTTAAGNVADESVGMLPAGVPGSTLAAGNAAGTNDAAAIAAGTGTATAQPVPPLGTATTASTVAATGALAAGSTAGIAGTPGTAPTTPAAGIGDPAQRLQQAVAMVDGDPVRARAELTRLLDSGALGAAERMRAYGAINAIAGKVLFSPRIVPGDIVGQSYMVKKGDSLERIARREKLGVDWRFIQRINGLATPTAIRPDQRLKLAYGPFDAEVIKAEFRFNVYAGTGSDRVMVASLPCGLGENDGTPTGTFRVRKGSKLVDPAWVNPRTGEKFASNDPKNPIGERWIGLEGTTPDTAKFTGYGIHGTVDPQSIGKQTSMGCVRLTDSEVQVVYELIGEQSTVVIK